MRTNAMVLGIIGIIAAGCLAGESAWALIPNAGLYSGDSYTVTGDEAWSSNSFVGDSGDNNTLTVQTATGNLTVTGYLRLGDAGGDNNTMNIITGGTMVVSSYISTGHGTGGAQSDYNAIHVNGTNSTLTTNNMMIIGRVGTGNTLNVKDAGTVNIATNLHIGIESTSTNHAVTVENGGTLGIAGGLNLGNGTNSHNQTVTVTGGTSNMTVGGNINMGVRTNEHTIMVSGGALAEVGGYIRIGGNNTNTGNDNLIQVAAGNSRLHLTDPTNATVHVSYNGTGNTLQVDNGGVLQAGQVIVGSGGTFWANGEINLGTSGLLNVYQGGSVRGAGTITGNADISGVLSPGNSAGTLTFNGSLTLRDTSVVQIQLGLDQASDVVAANSISVEGGTLVLSLLGGYEVVGGETFTILDSSSITGTFDAIDDSALNLTEGWYVDDSDLYTLGQVTIIPEPHTMGLILLGLGSVALRRRFRKA